MLQPISNTHPPCCLIQRSHSDLFHILTFPVRPPFLKERVMLKKGKRGWGVGREIQLFILCKEN